MKTAMFLRPEQLVTIRNLSLRARHIVEGTMAGIHQSPYHGFSVEFLEYRPYERGESMRYIDWRKYARTDKPMVKLFEDETNCFAQIILDKSASMGFASQAAAMTKFDYARTLAASLALVLIRQRDAVGFTAFDEAVSVMLPPRSTNVQLKNIFAALDSLEPGKSTRCGGSIDSVAARIGKRGLSIVISDLFDDPETIIHGLRHLRFKRQDIIVIWVSDPLEQAFSGNGPLRLRDLESGRELTLDAVIAADFYQRGIGEHRDRITRGCRELSIDLEMVTTIEPFQKALIRILDKRRRLF